MDIEELIEKIENPKVREWAKANPDLVLAALEAEYQRHLLPCSDCAAEATESQRCTWCGAIGCLRCPGCCEAHVPAQFKSE